MGVRRQETDRKLWSFPDCTSFCPSIKFNMLKKPRVQKQRLRTSCCPRSATFPQLPQSYTGSSQNGAFPFGSLYNKQNGVPSKKRGPPPPTGQGGSAARSTASTAARSARAALLAASEFGSRQVAGWCPFGVGAKRKPRRSQSFFWGGLLFWRHAQVATSRSQALPFSFPLTKSP